MAEPEDVSVIFCCNVFVAQGWSESSSSESPRLRRSRRRDLMKKMDRSEVEADYSVSEEKVEKEKVEEKVEEEKAEEKGEKDKPEEKVEEDDRR